MNATTDTITFPLWGGFATVVVTDPSALELVMPEIEETLAQVELAASNYRDDSDLAKLNNAGGRPVMVTETLATALTVALDAAAWTSGAVDPTVGGLTRSGVLANTARGAKRTSYTEVQFDRALNMVVLPSDVAIDLGATAKAWAADLCAQRAYSVLAANDFAQVGVLVSLAGDIAVAGPAPLDGWPILVTDDHRTDAQAVELGTSISITAGGLATSSVTTRRREAADGSTEAHIMDPQTWRPVESCWRTVSVAAKNCTEANAASTAAIVMGEQAISWLTRHGLPARLIRHDGSVTTLNGWPEDR